MEVIFYEDEATSGLYPITLTRPAFDIRTAGLTLVEASRTVFPKARFSALCRTLVEGTSPVTLFSNVTGPALFLNARLSPSLAILQGLFKEIEKTKEDISIVSGGEVVGFFTKESERISSEKDIISRPKETRVLELSWKLFAYPEEIIFFNHAVLSENLSMLAKKLRSKKKGIYIGKGSEVAKNVVFDTSKGPIVIADHVTVHSFVVLKGPLYIGESSVVKEFSVIEGSSIGPVCRVGGEIVGSVVDGYSNKQHVGGLADSYIGRWVNIGGGTFVSDLKNTYSTVSVMGRNSGAQFLGTIMGDFSKTSINTSIFPGKIIGVSAHIYGTVVEDVPAFTSYVRSGSLYELPLSLAERGQSAMAMRRGVPFTESDKVRMGKLFEMTQQDRDIKNVSKDKIKFS